MNAAATMPVQIESNCAICDKLLSHRLVQVDEAAFCKQVDRDPDNAFLDRNAVKGYWYRYNVCERCTPDDE